MAVRQVLRDTVMTGLLQATRLVGGLLLLPVLLQAMGPYSYGFVALGVSICTYSVMLESVLTPILRNELNLAQARGAREEVAKLQRLARSAAGSVMMGAAILSALLLLLFGGVETPMRPYVGLALVCVIAIALGAVGGVIDCLFSALDGLWQLRAWELTGTVVGFGAAAMSARSQHDPAVVLAALVVAPHVPKLWAWAWQVGLGNMDARPDLEALRAFVRLHARASREFLTLQFLLCILSTFPTLFVSSQLGLLATTLWTTAQRVMTAPANFVVALMPVAWPRITRAHAAGRNVMLRRVFSIGLVGLALAMLAWTVIALAYKTTIFGLLTSGTVLPPPALLAAIGVLMVITTCGAWISAFLNAFGEFGSQLRQTATTLAATLLLAPGGLWLAGLPGLVIGMLVAQALFGVVPAGLKARARMREALA